MSTEHHSRTMSILLTLTAVLAVPFSACGGAAEDTEGRLLPSDKQVITDITPADAENVVDVDVVAGKSGEAYFHAHEHAWYFDRGAVIKRKAAVSGAPDAVVVVGGLARYVLVGDRYEYLKFLTTYNKYEGIPAPSKADLLDYVREHLSNVFVSREHLVVGIKAVDIAADEPWKWHSAMSFSVPFDIHYRQIKNNTDIEVRLDRFDIRFYRDSVSDPLKGLMATETSRKQLAVEQFSPEEIRSMPTLRNGSF